MVSGRSKGQGDGDDGDKRRRTKSIGDDTVKTTNLCSHLLKWRR